MKYKISLMAIGFGVMLTINACQTPEERAAEMNTAATDATIANKDDTAETTGTQDSSTAKMNMDAASVTPNSTTEKATKGKATVGVSEAGKEDKMEMDKNGVYAKAEVMPSYPGGQSSLEKFVEDNLQYPQEAIDNGVEGKVLISFDVDESGKIYRPMIISQKLGYGLEEAALKVVKAMPEWNPGKMKGKNVKTKFTLPISYQLM